MSQNRNKLIDILIGNLSNAIVHSILERSIIQKIELSNKYRKELINSLDIAKRYREKINPKTPPFQNSDINYIRNKIIRNVKAELVLRISKGYQNINLNDIEPEVEKALKGLKIIE